MNSLQGQLTVENWEAVATNVMQWCKEQSVGDITETTVPFPSKPQAQPRTCKDCGAEMVHNPRTGKWFCKDKCWLQSRPQA